MTNKLEQDKQIIASAPEGATHFDGGVWAQSTGKQPLEKWNDMDWDYEDAYEMDNIRSLDDIREILALREELEQVKRERDCFEKYKIAIEDEMVIHHCWVGGTPKQQLTSICNLISSWALDPEISKRARAFQLEQQAKGVEQVLDLTCWSMMNTQGIDVQDVHELIGQLRKQASEVSNG